MKYTIEQIKSSVVRKGYQFFENGNFNLNIIGVRSVENKSNEFDDLLIVAYKDAGGKWQVKEYSFTTDPGKTYLNNPLDKNGTLVMAPGQYKGAYMIGIHGRSKPASRRYEALEQCRPMKYIRDNDKDSRSNYSLFNDPQRIISGIFKTNIHRSDRSWLSTLKKFFNIGANGAGCQVFQFADQFNEFLSLCKKSKELYSNSFTYTLMLDTDFV